MLKHTHRLTITNSGRVEETESTNMVPNKASINTAAINDMKEDRQMKEEMRPLKAQMCTAHASTKWSPLYSTPMITLLLSQRSKANTAQHCTRAPFYHDKTCGKL